MTRPNFHRWVYLIVDPGHGEQLAALPDNVAVWVVDSPQNTPVAQRLWPQRRATVPRAGLTTFRATAATPAEQLLDILGTVDEHEGEDSTGGGYAALAVIGCRPDADVEAALAEWYLRVDDVTENGFVARPGRPPEHLQPRKSLPELGYSLDAILAACGIGPARLAQLQAEVQRASAGCGDARTHDDELTEADWYLLSEVADYIWASDWAVADKVRLGLAFYQQLPHWYHGLVPLWRLSSADYGPLPEPAVLTVIWDALAHYLSRPEPWYHDTVAYALWVDFFEQLETAEPTWRGLRASPQLTAAGKVQLLACCGPVPYHLKAPFYQEMQLADAYHPHILNSLLRSASEVYGQLDYPAARQLLVQLRIDRTSEEYRWLIDKIGPGGSRSG